MATYGLVDWDLTQWEQPVVFNLEIMKKITYLRSNKQIAKMLPEVDFVRYSNIIIHKDYEDDDYPADIFNNPKTKYFGLVFSGGHYDPMDIRIEESVPDPSIYEPFKRFYNSTELHRRNFNSMLKGTHLRFSLDEKNIWENWRKQIGEGSLKRKNSIIIHDRAPHEVNGLIDELHSFKKELHPIHSFGFKFPINVYTEEDFLKWGTLPKIRGMSNIRMYNIFKDINFLEVANNGRKQNLTYIINDLDSFIGDDIVQVYKQIVFCGERDINLLLNITEKREDIWTEVVELMNDYSMYILNHKPISMLSYSKEKSLKLKADLLRIFTFLQKENYPLFKLFYECKTTVFRDKKLESRYIGQSN